MMLQLNHDTFIEDRLCFRVEREYTNAWGQHCLSGVLFDLTTMTIQRDALITCNIYCDRPEMVNWALRKALSS